MYWLSYYRPAAAGNKSLLPATAVPETEFIFYKILYIIIIALGPLVVHTYYICVADACTRNTVFDEHFPILLLLTVVTIIYFILFSLGTILYTRVYIYI